ncbi:hypothetical protein ILUMI_12220 [Ignelater luminosus]|uniref:Uncharacterized protein n=1 Tax=Ignelater luminosus TaxID=2038154 RepID=A0A8K0GD59_IGNLU|nr:hypothetical protein ILUMI_12220 [Ignelater luminosus]
MCTKLSKLNKAHENEKSQLKILQQLYDEGDEQWDEDDDIPLAILAKKPRMPEYVKTKWREGDLQANSRGDFTQ